MPPAGDRSHRGVVGRALMTAGGSIAVIAIASDVLGIGERADVGPRQALAAIVGIVLLMAGGVIASSRRSAAFRIAYALVVFVFSVLLFAGAEILLRAEADAWPFELEPLSMPYLTEKDRELGWRMPPGDGDNSLGFKNREIGDKAPGTCRILFLGDSLLYYGETPSGRTHVQELEARLGEGYEVINAGVPGYTTHQSIALLDAYGYGFEPDVVFLGFVLNDLFHPYLHRPSTSSRLAIDPKVRLTRFDTSRFPGSLFGWSYAAHELALGFDVLVDRFGERPSFPFERRMDVFLAWEDYGWRDTERLLAGLSNELERRRIPLYVIAFPIRPQVEPETLAIDRARVLEPQARLRAFLARHRTPMLDPQPILSARLFEDHLHLTEEGNAVLANFLWGFLKEEAMKWPPPCGR
jgi:lysophospholipase L1-like esterase